jgi:hypothetical protein
MAILNSVKIKVNCPQCSQKHVLEVIELSGVKELRCLNSDGIYRPDDEDGGCGYKFIVRWNLSVEYNFIQKVSYVLSDDLDCKKAGGRGRVGF